MVIRPDCIPLCPRTGRRYVHPLQIYLQSKLNEHKIVHSTSLIPTVYPTAQQTVHVRLASFSGFRSYLQENIDIRRSPPQGSAMYFYIMYNIFYYIMVHFLQYKATNFLRCDLKSAKVSDYPIDASNYRRLLSRIFQRFQSSYDVQIQQRGHDSCSSEQALLGL